MVNKIEAPQDVHMPYDKVKSFVMEVNAWDDAEWFRTMCSFKVVVKCCFALEQNEMVQGSFAIM